MHLAHAYGGGSASVVAPGEPVDSAPAADTKQRRSLVLDWPLEPSRVWGAEVWFASETASSRLVRGAEATAPYARGTAKLDPCGSMLR